MWVFVLSLRRNHSEIIATCDKLGNAMLRQENHNRIGIAVKLHFTHIRLDFIWMTTKSRKLFSSSYTKHRKLLRKSCRLSISIKKSSSCPLQHYRTPKEQVLSPMIFMVFECRKM